MDANMDVEMGITPNSTKECAYCCEVIPVGEIIETNCSNKHGICHDCIRTLHRSWIDNLTVQHVRCCNEKVMIPPEELHDILGSDLSQDWFEHFTATANPEQVYCSNSECLWPLSSSAKYQNANGTTKCRKCCCDTCTLCKKPAHRGRACGNDDDEEERMTIEMANERGWKRCFRCRNFCERKDGCMHLRCTCGAMFHYLCGKSIYHCKCSHLESPELRANPEVQEPTETQALPEHDAGQQRGVRTWAFINNAIHRRNERSGNPGNDRIGDSRDRGRNAGRAQPPAVQAQAVQAQAVQAQWPDTRRRLALHNHRLATAAIVRSQEHFRARERRRQQVVEIQRRERERRQALEVQRRQVVAQQVQALEDQRRRSIAERVQGLYLTRGSRSRH